MPLQEITVTAQLPTELPYDFIDLSPQIRAVRDFFSTPPPQPVVPVEPAPVLEEVAVEASRYENVINQAGLEEFQVGNLRGTANELFANPDVQRAIEYLRNAAGSFEASIVEKYNSLIKAGVTPEEAIKRIKKLLRSAAAADDATLALEGGFFDSLFERLLNSAPALETVTVATSRLARVASAIADPLTVIVGAADLYSLLTEKFPDRFPNPETYAPGDGLGYVRPTSVKRPEPRPTTFVDPTPVEVTAPRPSSPKSPDTTYLFDIPNPFNPSLPGFASFGAPGRATRPSSPTLPGQVPNPLPTPSNPGYQGPLTRPNAPGVSSPSTRDNGCDCGGGKQGKKRKPKKPRDVCYRGTYEELRSGLLKFRKEKIPCR